MPQQPIMPTKEVGARRKAPGGCPQKYVLDDRGRQLILNLYDGSKERTDIIQKQMPNVPRKVIHRWAVQLGKVTPRDYYRWTKEQDDFVRNSLHTMPMCKIEEYLKKDRSSIVRRAHRLGLYQEDNGDGYSMDSLCLALGVTNELKVYQWIQNGWLKGEKKIIAFKQEKWHFTD